MSDGKDETKDRDEKRRAFEQEQREAAKAIEQSFANGSTFHSAPVYAVGRVLVPILQVDDETDTLHGFAELFEEPAPVRVSRARAVYRMEMCWRVRTIVGAVEAHKFVWDSKWLP